MNQEASQIGRLIDEETGRVDVDLPCIRCMYNLRSLETGQKCPECGTSVDKSVDKFIVHILSPLHKVIFKKSLVYLRNIVISLIIIAGTYALLANPSTRLYDTGVIIVALLFIAAIVMLVITSLVLSVMLILGLIAMVKKDDLLQGKHRYIRKIYSICTKSSSEWLDACRGYETD
ncbi:hypothetical protein JD969_02040 [Planctomycetota bacterium]|nr:hypothetical protein JD969_02040 [Planctomycetota bacterium]